MKLVARGLPLLGRALDLARPRKTAAPTPEPAARIPPLAHRAGVCRKFRPADTGLFFLNKSAPRLRYAWACTPQSRARRLHER